jgi:hypothetical protein
MFHIYLVCSEINGQKLHKIGYTRRTVEQRIKEFKTGNASDIYIVDSFQSEWGTKIEAQLHRIYKSKKIGGEWFDLDDDEIKNFQQNCQRIHNNLTLISKENTYFLDKGDF